MAFPLGFPSPSPPVPPLALAPLPAPPMTRGPAKANSQLGCLLLFFHSHLLASHLASNSPPTGRPSSPRAQRTDFHQFHLGILPAPAGGDFHLSIFHLVSQQKWGASPGHESFFNPDSSEDHSQLSNTECQVNDVGG